MIRAADNSDAAEIAALWNTMIRDTLATFTTEEKTTSDIEAMIAARDDAFWVLQEDGVQGFVTYGPFRGGPGYGATVEHSIVLSPLLRGRGHGRALMQHAMQHAQRQDHHIMIAGISSANPAALAFHTALGFEQTGHLPEVGRKHGQWLDLILMQKTLHPS